MYRRRRRPEKEIAFSFDSFLDLVANVVGIIIRLILVAWVGARTYTGLFQPPDSGDSAEQTAVAPPEPAAEKERAAVEAARRKLAEAQSALLARLGEADKVRRRQAQTEREIAALAEQRRKLDAKAAAAGDRGQHDDVGAQQMKLSLAELQERARKVAAEMSALAKLPARKHTLTYRTPVAQTVQSEELHFELRHGRVTFLDVEALLREIRQGLRAKAQLLRSQWQVEDQTGPCGAFRLRYLIERQRGSLDAVVSTGTPDAHSDFRYGLT